MSTVMFLPFEVLELIFSLLDGRTFCISREVCKKWNEIIIEMQIENSLWKQFCIKEIPKNILEEIVGYKSISSEGIEWKRVYKKWFQSKLISKSSFSKRRIHGFLPNPITCIAVTGSCVLTCHNNGQLCVWNCNTGDFFHSSICHLRTINDMALVDLMNLETYYGSYYDANYSYGHHHVITVSKDQYIGVTSLLELPTSEGDGNTHNHASPHGGGDLIQVKVFGDNFAVNCTDNTISLWKMKILKKPFFHLNLSLLRKVIGSEDIVFSIGLWHNELQCISHAGKLRQLCPNRSDWVEKKYFKESYSEDVRENIVRVTLASLYRSNTAIMLTADGKLIVSINEKQIRHYCPMKHLHASVVCVALYGTVLGLGCENGALFLYQITTEEELINLNLSSPALTLVLSEASIISIDISFQEDSPVIAASTTTTVYIIKWYKPRDNYLRPKLII